MSGRTPGRISDICAVATVVGGSITLLGWVIHEPALTDWFGSGLSMLPNTAIGMIAAGSALLLRNRALIGPALMLSVLSGLIGAITFAEHLFGIDPGIDQLVLSTDWGQHGTMVPGRMGPPASFMFVLLNVALMLTLLGTKSRQAGALAASVAIGISSISLIGFLYGSASFYDIPKWTAISINTALLFTILAMGVIAALPDVQPMRTLLAKSATGALVRRALPLLIAVPVLIGWLRLRSSELEDFDSAFGITLRTIVEVVLLVSLLAWMARAVSMHERSLQLSEEQLRRSEQRYQAFLRNSSEGIWRFEIVPLDITLDVDKQLDLIYRNSHLAECNDAFAQMYGLTSSKELVGARLTDLLPRTADNDAYLKAFIENGYKLHNGESQEFDKDGNVVYFVNNLVGIIENGHVVRAWGTQLDITERRRAVEALRTSDRRKSEFLATLAHELRNPLAPLVSGMEILAATNADGQQELHGIMQRQLDHMVRLIDDLMDVSRIDQGKIGLRLEDLELEALLRSAIDGVMPFMDRKGHKVEFTGNGSPLWVRGDPVRLHQVFQNVLNNAAKYTPKGGSIKISCGSRGDHAVIQVQDDGIGLLPEHFGSIFEMFGQVDRSAARKQSGLGIGLALVKHLVADHGGTVEVHSEGLDKGSTFTIRLPLIGTGSHRPAHGSGNGPAKG